MKKITCVLLLLCAGQVLFAQNEQELINKVKAKLDKVYDYQAVGRMKIDVSFIKAPQSKVKIFYKSPNKFRIKKEGGISILPKGGVSINLNSIASTEDFTIIPSGQSILNSFPVKIIKLLPNDDNNDVVLTTLYIDEKNLVIRKSKVTTRESGTYEMEMSYGKYIDWGLPDKVIFTFNTKDYKLPKGVTFEYDNGEKKDKKDVLKNKKGKVEISYSQYVINKGIDDAVFK